MKQIIRLTESDLRRMIENEFQKRMVIKSINSFVMEEKHINNQVQEKVTSIRNKIVEYFRNENYSMINGLTCKRFQIGETITQERNNHSNGPVNNNSFPITIDVTICCFKDNLDFEQNKEYYEEIENNYTSTQQKTSYVVGKAISGQIDTLDLVESLQHEIVHYFQDINACKILSSNPFYELSLELMDNENIYATYIGKIIYYSTNWEQDAFINGLFAQLKEKKPITKIGIQDVVSKSQAFSLLELFIDYQNNITNHKSAFEIVLSNLRREGYRITFSTLLHMINSTIIRMKKRIDDVQKLYKKQLLNEGLHIDGRKISQYLLL